MNEISPLTFGFALGGGWFMVAIIAVYGNVTTDWGHIDDRNGDRDFTRLGCGTSTLAGSFVSKASPLIK